MFVALPSLLFSQNYPLQVILTPNDNFTSYLGELKENPGRYMGVRVINNSGREHNVFFHLKMERISPIGDISVYSNIDRKPAQGIPIRRGNNVIRMDQLSDNFSTHSFDDFEINGVQIDSPEDLIESLRAPEGVYKLCLIAYDYDVPPGSNPVMLSDPNFSCAQVKICYSASKIELISPVNTMIAGNSSNVVIQPKRNLLVQWTNPTTSCGASMGNVDYELKFTDIYDGQTEEDALNYNPILLSLSYKNKTSVMLDTMQYQGIFNNGKRYAIGVTATASNQDIAILNDGKTTPASFIYGELPPNKGQQNTVKSKPSITNVPDCGNAVPDNKELIATLNVNDEIQVGDYKLKLSSISKNDDGSFNGKGIINLAGKPLFNGFPEIKAKVEFDKLQVNTGNQVIDGIVRTVYDDDDKQKFFGGFGNDLSWDNNNLSKEDVEVLNENAKKIAQDFIKSAMPKAEAEVNFPIKVESNGIEVAVSGMSFGAKGATFDMLYFMKIHEGDKLLAFGAKNICTNNNNVNDAKFYLLKDIKTKIEGLDFAIIGGEGKTYVKWDRQGYQGIKLSAKLSVPDSVIIAKDGKKIDNVDINTSFNSWSNWEAEISIPDFKLAFCKDLSFDGLKARYDHKIDATGIVFSNLKMRLPDYIKGLDNISVESASISSSGFNLNLVKKNILSIDKGSIGGWGFSIDNLEFNIADNIFKTSNIAGKIKIPFFENEIAYGGSPATKDNALNLGITVKIGDNSSTKFLHYFNAEIAKTSKINIGNDGKIEAVLDGGVKVDEKSGCDFGFSATFSGFTIGTNYNDAEPKLDLKIGNWGTSTDSNNTWNGFGFQIKEFAFKDDTTGDNIELEFSVSADLQLGEGKFKIAGACKPIFKFDINKKTKEVSNPSFTLGSVMVAGEFSAVKLYGYLTMFDNDEKWGKGIRGDIDCTFPLKLQVKSKVCFGKTIKNEKNKKYFFADAAFKLPPELGINTGAINIYGFGGAFWWNLEVSGKDFSRDTVSDKNPVSHLKTMGQSEATVATSSGIELVPYTGSGSAFGFAADVYFCSSVGGPYMYNGQVGLGLAFEKGSFANLNLNGKIRVIGDGDEDDSKYVSTGKVGIAITDTSFSASAELYVNVLGVTKAVVPLGLRFDWKNGDFAFELGKPYYRPKGCDSEGDTWCIGSEFNIPGVLDINVTLQGYFCAGTLLNYDMPPLPQRVIDLLGSDNSKVKRGKAGTKKESAGIMMGTRYSLDFNFSFGPIYAKFESDIGFDLEIKQSKGQQCADGRKIEGLNGYYCRGQLYAFIAGDVGVKLSFFGKDRKFSLCSVEAGALLRGGFPNPTWFKGAVAVKGEILGGLITFNTSARFTVGSECKDPDQELDIVIIDEINPGFRKLEDAEKQVEEQRPSIYAVLAVTTFVPMNSPVQLLSLTDTESDKLETYRFTFERVELRKAESRKYVSLSRKYLDEMISKNNSKNKSGKSFKVKPADILEANTMYELTIVTKVWQTDENGDPIDPVGIDPNKCVFTDVVYFKTGELPNHIHKDNIVTAYPTQRQFETFDNSDYYDKSGYIAVGHDISYLFKEVDVSKGEYAFIGEFQELSNHPNYKPKPILFLYEYNQKKNYRLDSDGSVEFKLRGINDERLNPGSIYELNLYVVEEATKATNYTIEKEKEIIADEIYDTDVDLSVSVSESSVDDPRGVDIDKNLGGTKTGVGKHTGKVYEAIRGEQDARTNPLDGILRGGMNKGSEIINQGSIANKGSQNTNKGNTVGGLSQGSVSGGVGLGNQAMNQGQVTTYSNTGGTTTKSKAMPAIPSNPNVSSNVASHNGKVKEPAGTVSTISQIGKNNVGHINPIHITKNIIFKEQVDETKTTYQDYKDVTSNTSFRDVYSSDKVGNEPISSKFVEEVNLYKEESKIKDKINDIYQNAKLKHIFKNYFRMSNYGSFEEKMKKTKLRAFYVIKFKNDEYDYHSSYTIKSFYGIDRGVKEIIMYESKYYYLELNLPDYSTELEFKGGLAFSEAAQGIEQESMLQITPIVCTEESSMAKEWNKACAPLFKLLNPQQGFIKKTISSFELPYTGKEYLKVGSLEKHQSLFYYDNMYNQKLYLEPMLSDEEISTQRIDREPCSLTMAYWYHQPDMIARHFAYAMALGYQMYELEYLQGSVGDDKFITVVDKDVYTPDLLSGNIVVKPSDINKFRYDLSERDNIMFRDHPLTIWEGLRNQVRAVYGENWENAKPRIEMSPIGNVFTFYAHGADESRGMFDKYQYKGIGEHHFPKVHVCESYYFDIFNYSLIPMKRSVINFNQTDPSISKPSGSNKIYVKVIPAKW